MRKVLTRERVDEGRLDESKGGWGNVRSGEGLVRGMVSEGKGR